MQIRCALTLHLLFHLAFLSLVVEVVLDLLENLAARRADLIRVDAQLVHLLHNLIALLQPLVAQVNYTLALARPQG